MSLLVLRVLYLLFDSPIQGGGRTDDYEELHRLCARRH